MPYTYTLNVTNHSSHSDSFIVYQNDPGSFDPNAMAVAWFSKFSNPNSLVRFQWEINWGFSWAETGTLSPGVIFDASEKVPAGPESNKIRLSYNGAYQFRDQTAGLDSSRFYIVEDNSIPVGSKASVGITMSGSTVYATQARPNTNITATPHPVYYLAYGKFEAGQVIDVSTINNPLKLPYDTGIYSLSATLNANDSWTTPVITSARNTAFLAARAKNPKLAWTDDY